MTEPALPTISRQSVARTEKLLRKRERAESAESDMKREPPMRAPKPYAGCP